MLQIDIRDIPEQVQEKPLGCGGTLLLGLIGIGVLLFNHAVTDDDKKESSDSQKPQTEQVTTQTTKQQSIYTNTTSSSSASQSAGTNNKASESSTNSPVDASYQTYLALVTLLENDGKSLKLCEAKKLTKGQELNLIEKMSELQGTTYYNTALKGIAKYCPKYASEYSKNGKYFASDADFYQSYINPDYSKILKAKKKEKQ